MEQLPAHHINKQTNKQTNRLCIHCNFLKEVRLGGWGSEGPKGPTLDRHVSACATILRLRALLYML